MRPDTPLGVSVHVVLRTKWMPPQGSETHGGGCRLRRLAGGGRRLDIGVEVLFW